MPAKFYYVLAFEQAKPFQDVWTGPAPHFLGKTSDLSFKTEPDKTIDLDDGSTEVGSEKLSLSFSILEAIENPWPLCEIWLVPAISKGYYAGGEFPAGDVLRIFFRDTDDYHIETKSGEFELIRFSATISYAADAPAYQYYVNFFSKWRILLFPKLQVDSIELLRGSNDQFLTSAYPPEDRIVRNQAALLCPIIPNEQEILVQTNGNELHVVELEEKGIITLNMVLSCNEQDIIANCRSIFASCSDGYQSDFAKYNIKYCQLFGGNPKDAFPVFLKMMYALAAEAGPSVNLASITYSDLKFMFFDVASIAAAVEADYLPKVSGWELYSNDI